MAGTGPTGRERPSADERAAGEPAAGRALVASHLLQSSTMRLFSNRSI